MPNNLLLVPLLAGFLFLHFTHVFRFRAQRLDGYRLLMESAIAGALLASISRFVLVNLESSSFGAWLAGHWRHFAPFEYSGTAAFTLPLAVCFSKAWNLALGLEEAKDSIMKDHGNAFLKLLHDAQRSEDLISVTLDSRKWYVGLVAGSPNLSPDEAYFQLLPVFSGYRDKDNLETKRTVNYKEWLQNSDSNHEDFVITIPIRDVKIANRFDPELYQELSAPEALLASRTDTPAASAPEAPPK